jgi:hypothetical protein
MIGTDVMIADLFTKSLAKGKFGTFREFIAVKDTEVTSDADMKRNK